MTTDGEREPLDGWVKTTLWFKRGIDDLDPLEFDMWSPPNCEDKDYNKLVERVAGQIVKLLRNYTDKLIIQSDYGKARGKAEEYAP